jgi:hypothetical protein
MADTMKDFDTLQKTRVKKGKLFQKKAQNLLFDKFCVFLC